MPVVPCVADYFNFGYSNLREPTLLIRPLFSLVAGETRSRSERWFASDAVGLMAGAMLSIVMVQTIYCSVAGRMGGAPLADGHAHLVATCIRLTRGRELFAMVGIVLSRAWVQFANVNKGRASIGRVSN